MRKTLLAEKLEEYSGERLRGGEKTAKFMGRVEQKQRLRLFVPWAAPASGRDALGEADRRTIDWLFAADGLVDIAGQCAVQTEVILMPADSYAARNGFNMERAQLYWEAVAKEVEQYLTPLLLPASTIEQQPIMRRYMARRAYALEQLPPQTSKKVIAAAMKYADIDPSGAREAAGQYAMIRAAEADYVEVDLNALWVSLNVPERDMMCADGPRLYVPDSMRTPWLKEES